MKPGRLISHSFSGKHTVKKYFSKRALENIESAIALSEKKHTGEICFVIEPGLHTSLLLKSMNSRDRAIQVFSEQRIWDTEENSGVLLYLLLADRDIQIIADRGINRAVGESTWKKICEKMEEKFKEEKFEEGVVNGIKEITSLLEKHFPSSGPGRIGNQIFRMGQSILESLIPGPRNKNEIDDKPVVIG